jgi:hypothetical protein
MIEPVRDGWAIALGLVVLAGAVLFWWKTWR